MAHVNWLTTGGSFFPKCRLRSAALARSTVHVLAGSVGCPLGRVLHNAPLPCGEQIGAWAQVRALFDHFGFRSFLPTYSIVIKSLMMTTPMMALVRISCREKPRS